MLTRGLPLSLVLALCVCRPHAQGPADVDDFAARLTRGCANAVECEALYAEAEARASQCCERRCPEMSCGDAAQDRQRAFVLWHPYKEAGKAAAAEASRKLREEQDRARFKLEAAEKAEEDARFAEANERRAAKTRWDDAHAGRRAEIQELAKKPEYARPILSLRICESQDRITAHQQDMAKQKEAEALSGVVDLGARRAIAEGILLERAEIKRWKETLNKDYGATPMPCDGQYTKLQQCRTQFQPGTFTQEEQQAMQIGKATYEELYDKHALEQRCDEPLGTQVEILSEGLLQ